MQTHGVFLRLGGRRCVVVGGDDLAAAKASACAAAGGDVVLVAAELGDAARAVVATGVRHVARPYREGDLAGALLAYASTRDAGEIARLRQEATAGGVLLNVADVPAECDFFAGASVSRGSLQVLVGTGGAAPAVAAAVRRRIAAAVGPEYEALATVVAAVRAALAAHPERTAVLRRLAQSRLVDHLRDGDVDGAERLIRDITGTSCSLAALGVAPGAS